MQQFMPYKEFQHIKSAIHMQTDDEPRERLEGGRPYVRKIWIFVHMIVTNCMQSCSIWQHNAFD